MSEDLANQAKLIKLIEVAKPAYAESLRVN